MTQLCIKSKDHDTLKVLCPLPTYRIGAVSARGSQLGRKKTFYWTTPPTNNPPRFSFPANSVQPHHGNDRFRSEPFLSNSTIFPKQFFVQHLPSIQISFLLFLSRRFQSLFSESRHLLLPPFVCPKDLWFIFCFCALPFRQTTRLLQCCKQHLFWRARVSSCVYARAGRSLFVKKPYGGLSDHLPSTIFVSTKVRSFWEMAFQTTVKYRPR